MNRCCVIVCAWMLAVAALAQNVKEVLLNEGFENVRVALYESVVYASIENPIYRGTFRAPGVVLQKLAAAYPESTRFELIVEEYQVPRIAVHAILIEGKWAVEVDYETSRTRKVLRSRMLRGMTEARKTNSSVGKIDITLNPIVSLDNHRLDQLFEAGVFLAPTIETTLWRGNRINIQPIIPVWTNLDKGDRNRTVQFGSTNIQQEFTSGGKWYGTFSAGTFRTNRLGFNLDFGYKVLPSLSLGIRTNWTVNNYFANDKWYVGNRDFKGRRSETSALFKADYYEQSSSLQIQLAAGRFLYGDYGARLDCSRHFGDYEVGIFGVLTGGEHNAGFHFAIPVRGRRSYQPGRIRINLPEYYDLQYNMVSYYEYALEKMGQELEVRPIENRSLQYWQADYIERNLQKFLDGAVR